MARSRKSAKKSRKSANKEKKRKMQTKRTKTKRARLQAYRLPITRSSTMMLRRFARETELEGQSPKSTEARASILKPILKKRSHCRCCGASLTSCTEKGKRVRFLIELPEKEQHYGPCFPENNDSEREVPQDPEELRKRSDLDATRTDAPIYLSLFSENQPQPGTMNHAVNHAFCDAPLSTENDDASTRNDSAEVKQGIVSSVGGKSGCEIDNGHLGADRAVPDEEKGDFDCAVARIDSAQPEEGIKSNAESEIGCEDGNGPRGTDNGPRETKESKESEEPTSSGIWEFLDPRWWLR